MTLTTRHCIVETINRRHNALMPSVQVNDIAIYYELHGAGEPLVLINGLAADVSEYGDMIRWLAKRFTVLAFDNRGAGRTDKPHTPYSIEQMAADTAGLMQALGMKQAHVLGISMGGRIALALTLWHPGLVNRLVLVSTSAQGVRRGRRLRLLGVVSWLPILRSRYPQPRYAFLRQIEASSTYNCTDRLHEIAAPTMILHGRRDRTTPYQLAEALNAGIQGSRLIAFAGGHLFFMFRERQQFLEAVVAFLGH
jgi:3-oxoadipate enol-lactonase